MPKNYNYKTDANASECMIQYSCWIRLFSDISIFIIQSIWIFSTASIRLNVILWYLLFFQSSCDDLLIVKLLFEMRNSPKWRIVNFVFKLQYRSFHVEFNSLFAIQLSCILFNLTKPNRRGLLNSERMYLSVDQQFEI